jgi:vitamin B12 transporter
VVAKGERADFGTSGRTALPSFAEWNAAAAIEIRSGFWLSGKLDNLLDKKYEEVFGYGTARRSAYAGLEYRFGGTR